MSTLYQTNTIQMHFYSASSLKQQSMDRHVTPLYPDFRPTSLCSYSLILHAQKRSSKYQFHRLWFDMIGGGTHDLLHSRQACKPLHHLCRCMYMYTNQYSNRDTCMYVTDFVFADLFQTQFPCKRNQAYHLKKSFENLKPILAS